MYQDVWMYQARNSHAILSTVETIKNFILYSTYFNPTTVQIHAQYKSNIGGFIAKGESSQWVSSDEAELLANKQSLISSCNNI